MKEIYNKIKLVYLENVGKQIYVKLNYILILNHIYNNNSSKFEDAA